MGKFQIVLIVKIKSSSLVGFFYMLRAIFHQYSKEKKIAQTKPPNLNIHIVLKQNRDNVKSYNVFKLIQFILKLEPLWPFLMS